MVSLDSDGARKKSKKISGWWPSKPSRLGLYRSGHLSGDLTKLVEAIAGVVGGKDATTTVGGDEPGITGMAMGDEMTGASIEGEIRGRVMGSRVIKDTVVAGVTGWFLLRGGTSSSITSNWLYARTSASIFLATTTTID